MARRETIRRYDCDGTSRSHEIVIHRFRCVTSDGREMTIESDSAYAARERTRMIFGVEQVTVELLDDKDAIPVGTQGNSA